MSAYGAQPFGLESWGSVASALPDYRIAANTRLTEMQEWPWLVGSDGRPFYESIDPAELLLTYGDDALRYIAILQALFTDARAPKDAKLPIDDGDRRGWWADAYTVRALFPSNAQPTGSLLWLLSRSKMEPGTSGKIERYTSQALEFMKPAKLATRIEVRAAQTQTGAVACEIKSIYSGGGMLLRTGDFWRVYHAYHH